MKGAMLVGQKIVTLDNKPGTIQDVLSHGPDGFLYLVVLDGLEGLGAAPYTDEEVRPM